jgi:hypothetical protein
VEQEAKMIEASSALIDQASSAILETLDTDGPKPAPVMTVLSKARSRDRNLHLTFPILQSAMLNLIQRGILRLDQDTLMLVHVSSPRRAVAR